jgi:hypothetical protein
MSVYHVSCIKDSGMIPVPVTDVDNHNESICHHNDDDRRGANSRNFVQWILLSYALCKELFCAVDDVIVRTV